MDDVQLEQIVMKAAETIYKQLSADQSGVLPEVSSIADMIAAEIRGQLGTDEADLDDGDQDDDNGTDEDPPKRANAGQYAGLVAKGIAAVRRAAAVRREG